MNEVEKMYENCGIKNYRLENWCGFVPDGWKIIPEDNNKNKVKEIVREFTAEKQIELIKILTKKNAIGKSLPLSDLYMFYFECRHYPRVYMTFEEAIAECINKMWEDLRDYEKVQIKEILE